MKYFNKKNTYQWRGKTKQGKIISGEITAFSLNLAKAQLQKKGIEFINLQKKPFYFFNSSIKQLEIILFFRQLATLIMAGITMMQAIQIISQPQEKNNNKFLKILSTIQNDILTGNSLSQSLQKFPTYFDEISRNLILAGEKSGTVDIMLERIAQHKENVFFLKNKIKQAFLYPLILFLAATTVTLIMLLFVVPRFTDLFESAHTALPLFTLYVIHSAYFLKNYGLVLLLLLFLLSLAFYSLRYFHFTKLFIDTNLLRIPFIRTILQTFTLSRWARNISTLFAAGIPLTEAIHILIRATNNFLYRNAMQKIYLEILAGQKLYTALQKDKLFSALLIQMIQVGEESGTLEKMLTKIADFYEAELERTIAYWNRLLEPLIISILGVVIGSLVIAMYLPIFKLGTVI